jgi:UDP-N-acetylglucosamine--N-acetylmuramyl-(pentapeptide) pyrophosphoryl-undecaprenol N-acetylglucosamine transferase
VPINPEFKLVNEAAQKVLKEQLGFPARESLVIVTGGGLGAENINLAVAKCLEQLLPVTNVVLLSGANAYDQIRALTPESDARFQLHAFIANNMADYLGAADVVVTRAGATTILELAALGKATVLIPSPYLSSGHQLKNAIDLAEHDAVEVINEIELDARPQILLDLVTAMLANKDRLHVLEKNFHLLAKPHAARDMASMIVAAANRH